MTGSNLCRYDLAMRSDSRPRGQTFTEAARRRQLSKAAIEVLASEGFAAASLARIAQHAGISKGVISYHFVGKDELLRAVVESLVAASAEALDPLLSSPHRCRAALRAFLAAQGRYVADHPDEMLALVEIISHARREDGTWLVDPSDGYRRGELLRALLRRGQADGELRAFDVDVMAATVEAAGGQIVRTLLHDPDADLAVHGRELAELFDRAIRAD